MSSQDSHENLNECPMCLDELDLTDQSFKPCTCGYQMCRFCWHHIKENLNGRCPHCRKPYSEENYTFEPISVEEIKQKRKEKKQKERERKKEEATNRKQLSNKRVVQRNLVYITNIPLMSAKEDNLRKMEYFGHFGKILKIVVNRNTIYNAEAPNGPSVSCYVTYKSKDDAVKAIQAINGAWMEGRQLRASFGTTKYCTYFLRGLNCINPDCMYLHEKGEDKETFKEELILGKMNPQENTLVFPIPVKVPSKPNVLTSSAEHPVIPAKKEDKEKQSVIPIPETKAAPWAGSVVKASDNRKYLDPQEWPSTLKPNTAQEQEEKSEKAPEHVEKKVLESKPVQKKTMESKSALPPTASWASPSFKRNRTEESVVKSRDDVMYVTLDAAGSLMNAGESRDSTLVEDTKSEQKLLNFDVAIKEPSHQRTSSKESATQDKSEEEYDEVPEEEPSEYDEQIEYQEQLKETFKQHQLQHEEEEIEEQEEKEQEEQEQEEQEQDNQSFKEHSFEMENFDDQVLQREMEYENKLHGFWNKDTYSQKENWELQNDAKGLVELLLNDNGAIHEPVNPPQEEERDRHENNSKPNLWSVEEQSRSNSRFHFAQQESTLESETTTLPSLSSPTLPQENFWKSFLPHVNISFGRDSPETVPTIHDKQDTKPTIQPSVQQTQHVPVQVQQSVPFGQNESFYNYPWNQTQPLPQVSESTSQAVNPQWSQEYTNNNDSFKQPNNGLFQNYNFPPWHPISPQGREEPYPFGEHVSQESYHSQPSSYSHQFQTQHQESPFYDIYSSNQRNFVDPAILGKGHSHHLETQNQLNVQGNRYPWIVASSAYLPPSMTSQYGQFMNNPSNKPKQSFAPQQSNQRKVPPPPGLESIFQERKEENSNIRPTSSYNMFQEDTIGDSLIQNFMGVSLPHEVNQNFESSQEHTSSSEAKYPTDEDKGDAKQSKNETKKAQKKEKKKEKKKRGSEKQI